MTKADATTTKFHQQRIEDARARLWGAKAEFEARKKREWEQLKASLEADTYQAVWEARKAGLIIEDIKHAYGVSNSSVIYAVLRKQPQTVTPTPQVMAPYTVTSTDTRNQYQVTDGTHTVFVWGGDDAVAPYKYARALDTDSATALGWPMSKDPTHPAWAYVRELEAEGK